MWYTDMVYRYGVEQYSGVTAVQDMQTGHIAGHMGSSGIGILEPQRHTSKIGASHGLCAHPPLHLDFELKLHALKVMTGNTKGVAQWARSPPIAKREKYRTAVGQQPILPLTATRIVAFRAKESQHCMQA